MKTQHPQRPALRLTSAADATELVPPPDPKVVRRTIYTLQAALFGASCNAREAMYADDQADRVEALASDLQRILAEVSNLSHSLGR